MSVAISLRVSDEQHAQLVAGAEAAGLSFSAYVRGRICAPQHDGVWVVREATPAGLDVTVHSNEMDALHHGIGVAGPTAIQHVTYGQSVTS